jgi:hypothetical protein
VSKFSIPYSAFIFLIIATTISYSPIFHSRSSLLDIPNAMALSAELEKEQDKHDPFLLATPSLLSSSSLPFGTITGPEIALTTLSTGAGGVATSGGIPVPAPAVPLPGPSAGIAAPGPSGGHGAGSSGPGISGGGGVGAGSSGAGR